MRPLWQSSECHGNVQLTMSDHELLEIFPLLRVLSGRVSDEESSVC